MATEVDIPETIPITKIECEDEDQKSKQLDRTVYESCLEELKKVDGGLEKHPGTVVSSANADATKEAPVGTITVDTASTGDVGTLQGEIFLKSPSVSKVACEETCSISEHYQTDVIPNRAEVSIDRNQLQKDQENETMSGVNEGMEKTKEIAENGNESLDVVKIIEEPGLQQAETEETALKVGGESSKEERNIDQHVQIVDNQQDSVEENPESMKEAICGLEDRMGETETEKNTESESTKQFSDIKATLTRNKEALCHTLDSAEDNLDKEVETEAEAGDKEVSIDKNYSAKSPLIEEELVEKDLQVEEKEPEKPYNTVGTEKGSEAVGASENEGEEKREAEQIPCDGFTDDSISILKPNQDIENEETVDGPPPTLIKEKTPIEGEIEDKNNLGTPFFRQTEEMCCQKVENPVIFEEIPKIGSGVVKKSPPEDHQAEILEKTSQATAYDKGKDDEIDEQKESIRSQIQVQAVTEASAGEKRIEEKFTAQAEDNTSNRESVEDEEYLNEDKSKHEECPEQTFLQHDEPKEEKLERYVDVTSETKETVASSESVETISCVQDEISMKNLEESFDEQGKEDKPTDTVEINEHSVPKEKNFLPLDSNEVIERAEVEIPKEDENDLHVTPSFLEDTKQVDGEMLDKQKFKETSIVSAESTTLEHTSTEGGLQEAVSITSSIEADKLEKIYGFDYENKAEVEDVKEKIDGELQKNEENFDKETHEIATKCDDTEAGCTAEDTPVKVHNTTGAGEKPSDQSSSELSSKGYGYRSEDDAKSNINKTKTEEEHDGPRIPDPQDVNEEQIIKGNLRYLSPESIEETVESFRDDGDETERSKEEDNKDHITEEGNCTNQLPDSVAETRDFQDDEKEEEKSKGEILEEPETAQASKSLVDETNQDDEKKNDEALFTKQEERQQGEVKEPSVMIAAPNLEENLDKEMKEAKKDMNDANETGIAQEEDIKLLPETTEPRERRESKESETKVEKLKMGYNLEPEEESEGKDSKEIIEAVLVYDDPKIAGTDQDSDKHVIQEESTVVDISPKIIVEETPKSSKEDEHNEEVCEIIQTAVGSDGDTKKQTTDEETVIKDSFKVFQTPTVEEDTREQIKGEIENFKDQSPESIGEETLQESFKEDEVCEEFKIAVSSTDKENQKIDEHATPDLSSLPVEEKVINESSKECEAKTIELKEEFEDSNLELKEQIVATDSTEEPKLETERNMTETLDAETLPKESNESLVKLILLPYVSEKQNNKDSLEKEEPTMSDSETATAAVATTVLKCPKETEPEGDKPIEESDLTSEEKDLATTETKDVISGSEDFNVKPEELEVIRDTEILTVVNEAGEKIEYAMPDTEREDQTEVIEENKLMIKNVNTTLDATQNKETPFTAQTPEKMSLQTEDDPTCLKDDSELPSVEFGINNANEEVAKHGHEDLFMNPELRTVKYISGSEDVGILKEEVASEITNQSDISISEILKDKDFLNVGDLEAKCENEKPLNEANKCIESFGTFTNSEKSMEQQNLAEKFEDNLKDIVVKEKTVVELEDEIRSQESGASDTKETCTLKEENLESAHPCKELECASESVPETPRNKTLTEISDIQMNENNSTEQQITESYAQECIKEMHEEVEPKLDGKNNIRGAQSANETRSDIILTKEIPIVSEKEEIVQEEREKTERHSVSAGEETIYEVENCDQASVQTLKPIDSIVQIETVILENEELREGDASPLTIASNEAAMERQCDDKPEDFSTHVSEDNVKEGIIEQVDKCSDKIDIDSVTMLKEEKSLGEPQSDDKLEEDFNNDRSLQPIVKSETSSNGEGVHSLKFEETSDSVSKIPEDVDKEKVTVEKQVADEIQEIKNASHAVIEINNQCDKKIDETERSLAGEEPNAEEIEEEKHGHVIVNIIEKGEDENINIEDSFGTKTAEETCLQNEEPRELDFSKPIEGIQNESQNQLLKEECHTLTEEKLKSQENVSEMSNVNSPLNEENSELTRPTEYSSLEASKDEKILDPEGSNKNNNCSTTTQSLDETILPESGEKCKETSHLHEVFINSEETQIKEARLEAPVVELRSKEKQCEGNEDIKNEISNEISMVVEKIDEKENNAEQIINGERGKIEHHIVSADDETFDENLESADPRKELECASESVPETPRKRTLLTETSDNQINKNNSIEQQITESYAQECIKEMDEEVEPKSDNKNNIRGTQSANETRSDIILTEEIPIVSEKEEIIQEEREKTKHHSVRAGEETIYEEENCDQTSVQTLKATDSIVQIEPVILENEELREGDASLLTIASNEAAMERQCDEKLEHFSTQVSDVSEENSKEGIIEQVDKCSDKLDIDSVTVLKEEKSLGEPQSDDKPEEGFNNDRSLQPIVKSETSSNGEGVDNLKFEETSDSVSKIPTIDCEDVDKEKVTVEKQVADEIHEIKNTSHSIFQINNQCDKKIDETEKSLAGEEPNAEEIEEEKHGHVIVNIIEKGEDENVNIEDSFGTKTTEETCLQNEEPRELDFSKPIEGIQNDSQNQLLKEECHTSTEEKLKSHEDVSVMSNVDSPLNEENNELTRTTEYSSLEASKDEKILDQEGSNKNNDCSTTTQSLGEAILPESGEKCKGTSQQCEGNEDIKNEISNEEISMVVEKIDEKENNAEQIINEERGKIEPHIVSTGDETVDEVKNCDSASLENLKLTNSVVELETSNLEIEEHPIREGDASPITTALGEAAMEIQENKKPVDFFIPVSELSKENAEEGIIEQGNNCSDKLDIAPATVITIEKSLGEPQFNDNRGEGFNNVTEDSILRPSVKAETIPEDEGADNLKFEETSDLISKIPTIEVEGVDKETTTANEIEDTGNDYHAVSEFKNQCVKEIDETWKSLSVEEPNAGEFDEEIKHEHITLNIIEKRENENIEDSFGTKTREETCLQNEELRELDNSKPIKDIQKDNQNEQLKEEGDTSTKDLSVKSQADVFEMSDVNSLTSEKNNEWSRPVEYSSQEASKDKEILDFGGLNMNYDCSTPTQSLGEGILPELGEKCKETSYLQYHEMLTGSEETQIKEACIQAPVIQLRSEENQFQGNEGIKFQISNEEIREKKEADKESNEVSVSEETIKEIHQEDELIVEESLGEKTKETLTTAQNRTQNEELPEEIQKASTSMNSITEITREDRVAKDHDLVFVDHANENLLVLNEAGGKNFKEARTQADLENEFDRKNYKDSIEVINLTEQVTPDSELDLDKGDINYIKETTITKKEEEPNTNLGVPLVTGPATEEAVHENVGEIFEDASETHPRELVRGIQKEIDISVADNQESFMDYEKHKHTFLESTSDGIEVKKDLKHGQEVSNETEISSVNENSQEEIPNDDRNIREDGKKQDLVFDKHIAVETSIAAERTAINDDREHTESKEPLEESTKDSNRKPDEAEMDNTICKNEDGDIQDETEKPSDLIDIRNLDDIAMLQRGSTADLSGVDETTQNNQKLEKTSDYTSEKQIPGEVDKNEGKETAVAAEDKDAQLVVLDPFAKTLQKTEVEDLKPEITTAVESEKEAVKCDEDKITDDAGEEKDILSYLLQKSSRKTLQTEKEDTPKEEGKTDEEKHEEEEGDEHKKDDSGSDAPVMVEASRDMDVKVSHKKSHGILSGVSSKVKHSISKVKKAITGKSSHSKPISPK